MPTIEVTNLPEDITAKEIEEIFFKYGKIDKINLDGTRATVRFVKYQDAEAAKDGRDGFHYDGFTLGVTGYSSKARKLEQERLRYEEEQSKREASERLKNRKRKSKTRSRSPLKSSESPSSSTDDDESNSERRRRQKRERLAEQARVYQMERASKEEYEEYNDYKNEDQEYYEEYPSEQGGHYQGRGGYHNSFNPENGNGGFRGGYKGNNFDPNYHARKSRGPTKRTDNRVIIRNLPDSGSWQDLKDHFREAGDVSFSDVFKEGDKTVGVVEFIQHSDMKYAVEKLNNTKFRSHAGDTDYIELHEDPEGHYANRSSKGYQMQLNRYGTRGGPIDAYRGSRGYSRGGIVAHQVIESSNYPESEQSSYNSFRGTDRGRGRPFRSRGRGTFRGRIGYRGRGHYNNRPYQSHYEDYDSYSKPGPSYSQSYEESYYADNGYKQEESPEFDER